MSTTYPYTRVRVDGEWELTPENLGPAVIAAFPANPLRLQFADTAVDIVLENAVDEPTLAGVVAATKAAFDPVPVVRARKIQEIRDNTAALIAQGAVYSALTYTITDPERTDILSMYTVGVVAAVGGFFPMKVTTTDGLVETSFADAAAFQLFFTQMMDTYVYWKETGQVLRQTAIDATTVAQIDAIDDTRTWPMP